MLHYIGSYKFLVTQLIFVAAYVLFQNYSSHAFDKYPYILLNLALSLEAAMMTPLLLIASNKAAERDREIAETTLKAIKRVETKILEELEEDDEI